MNVLRCSGVAGIGIALALACGGAVEVDSDGGSGRPALPEITLSEEDSAKAAELVATAKGRAFDHKLRKGVNANIWMYIAATASKPDLVQAALLEMRGNFVTEDRWVKDGKQLVDDDYEAVILHFLHDDDPKIESVAIEAARNVVRMKDQKDSPVREWILGTLESSDNSARQLMALETMQTEPEALSDTRVAKAFRAMLDKDEPWAVSATLFRLNVSTYTIEDKPDFRARYVELLKAKDPGVRGRAAEGLGLISSSMGGSSEKEEAAKLLTPMLTDENAYTRAAVVKGLASLRDPKAIHEFMKLLGDTEKCRWDISYKDLAGKSARIAHDGSAWSRVDDAALNGIQTLSYAVRNAKFERPKVDYKKVDEDMAKGVKAAKSWYAANKSKL